MEGLTQQVARREVRKRELRQLLSGLEGRKASLAQQRWKWQGAWDVTLREVAARPPQPSPSPSPYP